MAIIGVTCLRCGSCMFLLAPSESKEIEIEGLYEASLLLKCKVCGSVHRSVLYSRLDGSDVINAACRQMGADC